MNFIHILITLFLCVGIIYRTHTSFIRVIKRFWVVFQYKNKKYKKLLVQNKDTLEEEYKKLYSEHKIKVYQEQCKLFEDYKNKFDIDKENEFLIKKNELTEDFEGACEDIKAELKKQIEELDNNLELQQQRVYEDHIVSFQCACNKKEIPCYIDLSKDVNTFVCDECGCEYRIEINMYPILITKSINDDRFIKALNKIK